jgi:copper resistance protein B
VRIRITTLACALALAACAHAHRHDGAPDSWPDPHPHELYGMLLFDQLEYAASDGDDRLRWDVDGWIGGDDQRLVVKSEGERNANGESDGDLELQLLYARPVTPFWDFQLGVRQDARYGAGENQRRTSAVIGFEGIAPQWIDIEPALFVSDEGDAYFRVEATHDLYVTQRIVAQSRLEFEAAFSNDTRFGVRSGLNDLELGLRLRYEVRRELAPYLGLTWTRKLGNTRDLARRQGDEVDDFSLLLGLRFWF